MLNACSRAAPHSMVSSSNNKPIWAVIPILQLGTDAERGPFAQGHQLDFLTELGLEPEFTTVFCQGLLHTKHVSYPKVTSVLEILLCR